MTAKIGRINLDTPNETLQSAYYDWECRHKNVISSCSGKWITLHQVKKKALAEIIAIFTKYGVQYRNVRESVGVEGPLRYVVDLRCHYEEEFFWPGVNERNRTVEQLLHARSHNIFTGLSPETYDILLARLAVIPDKPDINGFRIEFKLPEEEQC